MITLRAAVGVPCKEFNEALRCRVEGSEHPCAPLYSESEDDFHFYQTQQSPPSHQSDDVNYNTRVQQRVQPHLSTESYRLAHLVVTCPGPHSHFAFPNGTIGRGCCGNSQYTSLMMLQREFSRRILHVHQISFLFLMQAVLEFSSCTPSARQVDEVRDTLERKADTIAVSEAEQNIQAKITRGDLENIKDDVEISFGADWKATGTTTTGPTDEKYTSIEQRIWHEVWLLWMSLTQPSLYETTRHGILSLNTVKVALAKVNTETHRDFIDAMCLIVAFNGEKLSKCKWLAIQWAADMSGGWEVFYRTGGGKTVECQLREDIFHAITGQPRRKRSKPTRSVPKSTRVPENGSHTNSSNIRKGGNCVNPGDAAEGKNKTLNSPSPAEPTRSIVDVVVSSVPSQPCSFSPGRYPRIRSDYLLSGSKHEIDEAPTSDTKRRKPDSAAGSHMQPSAEAVFDYDTGADASIRNSPFTSQPNEKVWCLQHADAIKAKRNQFLHRCSEDSSFVSSPEFHREWSNLFVTEPEP